MSRVSHQVPLVVVALGLVLATPLFPKCVDEPYPSRIRSAEELEEQLFGESSPDYGAASEILRNLWDGRRDIAMDALQSERDGLRRAAVACLARIGDPDALAALHGVLADTSSSILVRQEAAAALSYVRDESAIPLIEELIEELGEVIGPDGRTPDGSIVTQLRQNNLKSSIKRLLRPDLRRPLVERGDHFIRYRFLLDDIESISFIADSGAGYPPELVRPGERYDHRFPADEHRRICDLLQDGGFAGSRISWEGEYLVIRLSDGRGVTLVKSGDLFCQAKGDPEWVDHFCVRAAELAEYLADVVAADLEQARER